MLQVEIGTEVLIFKSHENLLGEFADGALQSRRISMINVDGYALARHLGGYPPVVYTEKDDSLGVETCEMNLDEAQNNSLQYRVVPKQCSVDFLPYRIRQSCFTHASLEDSCIMITAEFWSGSHWGGVRRFWFWEYLRRTQGHFIYGKVCLGIAYTGPYERAFNDDDERDVIGKRQMWWRTSSWRVSVISLRYVIELVF